MTAVTDKTVAIVGGTGKLGAAISRRLARAGISVVIGSRAAESAQAMAETLGHGVTGMSNADAAMAGDIVIVTVPFAAEEVAPSTAALMVVR